MRASRVPPFDEEQAPVKKKIKITKNDSETMRENFESVDYDGTAALPPELRAKFDAMKTLIRTQKVQKQATTSQEGTVEPMNREWQNAEAEELAVTTALSIDREISRLTLGIAELEDLISSISGQHDGEIHSHAPFPQLPNIVPMDFDSFNDSKGRNG